MFVVDFEAEGTPVLNPNMRWEGQKAAVIVASSTLLTQRQHQMPLYDGYVKVFLESMERRGPCMVIVGSEQDT